MTEVTVSGTMAPLTRLQSARIVTVLTRQDIEQAAAQAKISGYTAQALANAVEGLKADRKTLDALETRAVVDAYTKMIQSQKKEAKRIAKKEDKEKGTPKQDRYWEGVDYYV